MTRIVSYLEFAVISGIGPRSNHSGNRRCRRTLEPEVRYREPGSMSARRPAAGRERRLTGWCTARHRTGDCGRRCGRADQFRCCRLRVAIWVTDPVELSEVAPTILSDAGSSVMAWLYSVRAPAGSPVFW